MQEIKSKINTKKLNSKIELNYAHVLTNIRCLTNSVNIAIDKADVFEG